MLRDARRPRTAGASTPVLLPERTLNHSAVLATHTPLHEPLHKGHGLRRCEDQCRVYRQAGSLADAVVWAVAAALPRAIARSCLNPERQRKIIRTSGPPRSARSAKRVVQVSVVILICRGRPAGTDLANHADERDHH